MCCLIVSGVYKYLLLGNLSRLKKGVLITINRINFNSNQLELSRTQASLYKKRAMRIWRVYMKYCSGDRMARGPIRRGPGHNLSNSPFARRLPECFMYCNYLKCPYHTMRVYIFEIYDTKYTEIRKQNRNCFFSVKVISV
jgi:hypothetical protein